MAFAKLGCSLIAQIPVLTAVLGFEVLRLVLLLQYLRSARAACFDYVGSSKWDFISLKRGERTVSAKITHEEWMKSWKNHEIQILPGDALLVMIQTTRIVSRSKQHERYEDIVTEVLDVIPQSQVQQSKLEFEQ